MANGQKSHLFRPFFSLKEHFSLIQSYKAAQVLPAHIIPSNSLPSSLTDPSDNVPPVFILLSPYPQAQTPSPSQPGAPEFPISPFSFYSLLIISSTSFTSSPNLLSLLSLSLLFHLMTPLLPPSLLPHQHSPPSPHSPNSILVSQPPSKPHGAWLPIFDPILCGPQQSYCFESHGLSPFAVFHHVPACCHLVTHHMVNSHCLAVPHHVINRSHLVVHHMMTSTTLCFPVT